MVVQAPQMLQFNSRLAEELGLPSAELDAEYKIDFQDGQLHVEHARIGRLSMSHHVDDRFDVVGEIIRQIRFHRKEPGEMTSQIVGLTAVSHVWSADAYFKRLK